MNMLFYLDTSGSMSDEMIRGFTQEVNAAFLLEQARRAKFLLWQRRAKPERARNRIRRASRRANR
jgi:hypothetical protein